MRSRPRAAVGWLRRVVREILRHPRAEEDLLEVWSSVARDGVDAADALLDVLQRKLTLAATRPLIGRDRSDLSDSMRSLVCGNDVLSFRWRANGIELVRVLSRYRDFKRTDFNHEPSRPLMSHTDEL